MQTKREAQTEQAAPREHSMAKQDIDFSAILDTGYDGYLGQEFIPVGDPRETLRQAFDLCNLS